MVGYHYKGSLLLCFDAVDQWYEWLSINHALHSVVWIKIAKKGALLKTVTYDDARNVAIAFGWIDGLINAYDDECYLLRCTPRKPHSKWSESTRAVAEQLIAKGEMTNAGMLHVEAAKRDGRW